MDLKTHKYINNTGKLPQFEKAVENFDPSKTQTVYDLKSFKSRWKNGGSKAAANAVMDITNTMALFDSMKTPANYANDFVGKYGINNYNLIDGIGFQQYNDINTINENNRMSAEYNNKIKSGAISGATTGLAVGSSAGMAIGGTLGSWLGPIGAVAGLGLGALFGGLFGSSARDEEERLMRIAQVKQNNANEFWRTGALSAALRNKELEDVGNAGRFNLFSSALGDENVNPKTGKTTLKYIVHTSDGVGYDNANAKVDNNELIVSKEGSVHKVVGNPNVTDGEYAKLKKGDNVASDKLQFPGTNLSFADVYPLARATGNEKEFWNTQAMVRNTLKYNKKQQALPHAWSGLEGLLSSAPGIILSWRDYSEAANEDVDRSNITPYNKYGTLVANIMGGRKTTPYHQMRTISDESGAQRYRNNLSGGLSAMQKTMANVTNNMNTQIARSNAVFNTSLINNEYDKERAQMFNTIGSTLMDADMRSSMFNKQYNAQSKAALTDIKNKSKYNMLNYYQQGLKNAWALEQFDKNYKLYAQDVANDTAYIEWLKNRNAQPRYITASEIKNVLPQNLNPLVNAIPWSRNDDKDLARKLRIDGNVQSNDPLSDSRLARNIQDHVLGLNFMNMSIADLNKMIRTARKKPIKRRRK